MSSNDLEFLRTAISAGTLLDSMWGLDVHLENWRLFTQYFPGIHICLKHLRDIRDNTLIVDITTTFTISEKSMWHVFPPTYFHD
ncbi:hypothetical protein PHMEG_00013200 [Phytophthora megakarya]|uniref:Uncharacterized protein n=1 Tax=Phytophthora megakarya TaxID=4795 RepID=A0A225W6V1_9STRA|nr:hypothetical protein PHMEG_00013200 [Phytophthora megakarya]